MVRGCSMMKREQRGKIFVWYVLSLIKTWCVCVLYQFQKTRGSQTGRGWIVCCNEWEGRNTFVMLFCVSFVFVARSRFIGFHWRSRQQMEHFSPRWAGAPASHLCRLSSVESKALKTIGLFHDEAEAQGLLLPHRRLVGLCFRHFFNVFRPSLLQNCSLCSVSPSTFHSSCRIHAFFQ